MTKTWHITWFSKRKNPLSANLLKRLPLSQVPQNPQGPFHSSSSTTRATPPHDAGEINRHNTNTYGEVSDLGYNWVAQRPNFKSALRVVYNARIANAVNHYSFSMSWFKYSNLSAKVSCLFMTELWTTSSPSVKRQPAGVGKIESYKWKDMRPAGLVQIQAVDTTVLPPLRLRRLTASSSPINIALNWGWRHPLPKLVSWANNIANYPCHTHQDQTIHSPFLSKKF